MGFFRVSRSFFLSERKKAKKKIPLEIYVFKRGNAQKKPYRKRGNSGGGGTVVLFPKPNRR